MNSIDQIIYWWKNIIVTRITMILINLPTLSLEKKKDQRCNFSSSNKVLNLIQIGKNLSIISTNLGSNRSNLAEYFDQFSWYSNELKIIFYLSKSQKSLNLEDLKIVFTNGNFYAILFTNIRNPIYEILLQ